MTNNEIRAAINILQDAIRDGFDASNGLLDVSIGQLQQEINTLQDQCPHNEGIEADGTCKVCYKYLG